MRRMEDGSVRNFLQVKKKDIVKKIPYWDRWDEGYHAIRMTLRRTVTHPP